MSAAAPTSSMISTTTPSTAPRIVSRNPLAPQHPKRCPGGSSSRSTPLPGSVATTPSWMLLLRLHTETACRRGRALAKPAGRPRPPCSRPEPEAQPASELDSPVDFVATKGDSRTAVIVKYRRHVIGIKEIEAASGEVTRSGLPPMVVTNAPLPSRVQEFNSTWGDRHPRAEVVTWRNEASDQLLLRVFTRTVQP